MADSGKAMDRYLHPIDVWSMAFGLMVGWGVFAMPGNTFLPIAGPAGTLIAFAIGMVIVLVVGSNISYMMGRSAITGGIYSYVKDAFGRDHSFLCAWFLCLSYLTIVFLNGTALFYVVRVVFGEALQSGISYTIAGNSIFLGETVVSVLVLAGVGLLFVVAKPALQKLQTILGVVLLIGVLATSIACVPSAISSGAFANFGTGEVGSGYGIFSIVVLAPWAFVGFEAISFDTAHFKFPMKRSKWLIALAIIAAGFAYASMALVSVAAVPDGFASWQDYISALGTLDGVASVPTFFAAAAVMGPAGLAIMAITAIAAIFTGIIGGYRATTRVLSTMAEDHILSERFSKTSYTIIFIMVIAIVLSFFGRNTLNWFVDLTSFGAIVAFGYASAAAWKTAKMEGNRARHLTGIVGTLIAVLFVLVQLIPHLAAMEAMGAEAFLLLSLWCLLGFMFYWRTINHSNLTEYSGISTSGVVFFALVIYSSLMWLGKLLVGMETVGEVREALVWGGLVALAIVFAGLTIMQHVQKLIGQKHEAAEREKIRAVEGSLAKSQFLFNMSHDIRTPMNAIVGYVNLALKEPSSATLKDYLKKIELSSRHLLDLINDILEMSRIESGTLELEYAPTNLCSVFDGLRELFSEQMKQKQIDYSVHTSQVQNRYVWCDQKNLSRVLLNVLSNAYKFTPSGGTISASLWEIGNGEGGYGSYEMRVQDTGIGMSKEFVEKMFNAFERERTSTESGIEGTGLGLAITKNLIDLMGGTIEVLTAPGSGTQIVIRLRFKLASQEDVAENPQLSHGEDPVDFSGKRLLLVEDNVINMEIASMILEQMGFAVETAENGQIALEKVSASDPAHFDAILMDIQMPIMDGYEATRAIRKLDNKALAGIPILAMTANAFQEDVQAALDAGMQAHIAKPIDINVLISTLKSVL